MRKQLRHRNPVVHSQQLLSQLQQMPVHQTLRYSRGSLRHPDL